MALWSLAQYYTKQEVFQEQINRRMSVLEQTVATETVATRNALLDNRDKWITFATELKYLRQDIEEVKKDTSATRRAVQ